MYLASIDSSCQSFSCPEDVPQELVFMGSYALMALIVVALVLWAVVRAIRGSRHEIPQIKHRSAKLFILTLVMIFLFFAPQILAPVLPEHHANNKENSNRGAFQGAPPLPDQDSSALNPCDYNAQDTCKRTPSADFYPTGGEGVTNPVYNPQPGEVMKGIAGRIAAHDDNSVTLKTSSGRIFRIEYPIDAFTDFNTYQSQGYGFEVANGDYIYVSYQEAPDKNSMTVPADHMFTSGVVMQDAPKGQKQTADRKY